MKVYHVTDAAPEILANGFRDAAGSYGFATIELSGVFVSDEPLSVNDGVTGSTVLEVELSDSVLAEQPEIIEELKGYREWVVPAEILNAGSLRVLDEAEVDDLKTAERPPNISSAGSPADNLRTRGGAAA